MFATGKSFCIYGVRWLWITRVWPTSSIIHVFAVPAFKRAVPVGGVVSPPARHLLPLLAGLFHPRRAVPPSCSLLETSPNDAKPASVRQWTRVPWSYRVVPSPSAAGAALPYEAGVEEDEASRGEVEEDEGEESHRFPAEVALYLQQRFGHADSTCRLHKWWWKLIKRKNRHQIPLKTPRWEQNKLNKMFN